MIALPRAAAACLAPILVVTPAFAAEPAAKATSVSVTGMFYAMRDQPDFGVGIGTLDRGALHLEARYQYEAPDSGSAFVGWKFSGGDALTFEVTPILGVLGGATRAVIPGVEASFAYGPIDVYVEAEYVRLRGELDGDTTYVWSELGWTPVEWLRVGLVGQRTRTIVDNGRDLQRGAFAQVKAGPGTLGVYAFNPGDASRYWIVSLGAKF